ncbi:hypothetical protein AN218_02665 [Streptomyces nanshensis]|uniref:Uncharacterized protein n=2 Tax=Streptomyces nanshensis TaxID=518642 RepID=A0A1E7LBT4_9ACTN|nr:hypothetical protein AN218_02665 [Streptomyces nanshensis]
MGDKVTSAERVATREIGGRRLEIMRLTWRDAAGLSYDVTDADSGDDLTPNESFDDFPTDEQLAALVEEAGEPG